MSRQLTDVQPMTVFPNNTNRTVKSYIRGIFKQIWTPEEFYGISSARIVRRYPASDVLSMITFAKGLLLGFGNSTTHLALYPFANLVRDCIIKIRDDRKSKKRKHPAECAVNDCEATETSSHAHNTSASKKRTDQMEQAVSSATTI